MRLPILIFLVSLTAYSQTVDRTKPPQTPPLPDYKLPPVTEVTLPNGLRVVAVEDKRFPMVHFRLGFNAGTKFDPADMSGLASMTGDLLKEGTKTRSQKQIADELASLGANIEASASPDWLMLTGSVLSENLDKQLELLADMALNANFPENEVALRKENIVQELMAARSNAETLAQEKFMAVIFGSNPYSRVLPVPASIEKIDRAALAGFRDRYLSPNNALLVMVGAVPARDELQKMVQAHFGSWAKKDKVEEPKAPIPPAKRSIVLVDRPGSVQADIRAGQVAVTRASPDYFPLVVSNNILGGGANSRMFVNIRERLGYAYQANSAFSALKDSGYFSTITEVRNEVLEPAMTEMLKEMGDMAKAPVEARELTDVKNYITGSYVVRMASPAGLATQLATVRMMGMTDDYLERYVSRVRSVEPGQIKSASSKYIAPANASIVVVGDASKIGKALEKFGDVKMEKAQ
jgi:zinc protease